MVFYKRKRNYRRKIYRKKRVYRKKTYRPTYRRRRVPNAFPDSCVRYLNYQEETSVDAPGVGLDYKIYRCNDLYDPRDATGGHQPYGLDQLTTLYKYWRVYSSTITITPVEPAVADTTPCYIAVVRADDNSTPTFTDAGHFFEYCKRMGSRVITVGSFQAQNSAINQKLYCKWSYRKWFKANPQLPTNWGLGTTAAPEDLAYFKIICYSVQGNNPATRYLRVNIGYKAKFFTPLKIPES